VQDEAELEAAQIDEPVPVAGNGLGAQGESGKQEHEEE
jgi:hypothetical protein